ncbi:UPF0182 family protein [Leptolyngbya sp. FACHB-541]|uniref:UPF0182 family protein n=1 Tax=Leptolyngbya sp. FACHB-541 TaxID=2692810 RepID=UPI0016844899|nr:UPF0182 family protein [Leptolyngbya sp. FACHB-541]MBD1996881.1 UPF0182 family protein [Leptolyngbya sp. FACHB-541]
MFSRKHLLPQKKADYWRWAVGLFGILFLLDLVSFLIAEGLWFQTVDSLQVFWVRVQTQGLLGLLAFGLSAGLLLSNLAIARQHAWLKPPDDADQPAPARMGLLQLLPLTLSLSLIIGVMLLYHGQVAVSHWHPRLSLYSDNSQIPVKFQPELVWQIGQELSTQLWQVGFMVGLAIALLIYPQPLLVGAAILMSLAFGLVISEHWAKVLPYFNPTPFGEVDPQFGQDISFYIFKLPVWELLEFWLIGLLTLAFVSVLLIYLLSGDSLSQGRFSGFSGTQRRHLYGLGGGLMLAIALSYWLDRYTLLYSRQGVVYGASYTNVTVQLPGYTILSLLAALIGAFLLFRTLFWTAARSNISQRVSTRQTASRKYPASTPSRPLPLVLVGYLLLAAMVAVPLPLAVQRFVVQPNELELERPFIQRTITLTRKAFNLDQIEVETFVPEDNLTTEEIQRNDLTISNVRLWDTRPLLQTNRQLQRIRLYYEFPGADIDRYTLLNEAGETERRQVLIAARELDYNSVPAEAQTWVNKHLIYTHGYGFTLSPVNTAGPGGLPDYFVRGIEQIPSSDRIRDSIPLDNPRIYYGELTNTYVMTQTRVSELDFPSGSENVYNSYDGLGGVDISGFGRRLIFAKHLRDWQMMLTEDFTPQTRLLFRRNIMSRVRAIAPFLHYDRDPYLVVANAGNGLGIDTADSTPNYLYWVIDAYTTSDRYPYSDPADNDFNYIRNSVKVVVDAYNGKVHFYVADPQDPIINTWGKIFPDMFQPLDQLPAPLLSHIRYPQDFYRVQSNQLMTYHMTDPQVFYNREDQWRAPNEIYGNEQQLVEPYYLIMKLPAEDSEEFILFRPFTPVQRNNMIAWLAARSDGAGESSPNLNRYGRLLLYRFPKQELVYGPEQIEARINQDPVISQQISLWNRRGSRAIQGNLLVIPIEQSLLYIEPLYLEAEQNQLPTLVRVIVVYENRIAMAETLEQALAGIFQPDTSNTPTIVRPVGELLPPEGGALSP